MSKRSLLLIDDDAAVRDIVKSDLEKDYHILEAFCYADVIKLLNRHIDLAIIDYVLPERNGFEVLKALREVNPSLPAIIMTGYSDEKVVIKAIRENVMDYLPKPVNLGYLKRRISQIFGDEDTNEDNEGVKTTEEFILDGMATHIEENYMKDLKLENLARMAGMSKFRFCRAFKEKLRTEFHILFKQRKNQESRSIAANFRFEYHGDSLFCRLQNYWTFQPGVQSSI